MVMREALEGFKGGVQIGGRRVTNLRYADDIIMLATSESELQEMMDRTERACNKYELQINSDVVPGVEGADNNDYALVIRRWKNRGHDRSMNSAPPLPPAVDKLCRLCQQLQGRDNSIPSQQAYALNPPLALSIISDRMPACTCPTMSVCPFNYHWDYEL